LNEACWSLNWDGPTLGYWSSETSRAASSSVRILRDLSAAACNS